MRKLLIVIMAVVLMGITVPKNIYAASGVDNDQIEPLAVQVVCPTCTAGADRVITYGDWTFVSMDTCSHYANGHDNKYKRTVKTRIVCSHCGHDRTTTSTQYKTVCAGFN